MVKEGKIPFVFDQRPLRLGVTARINGPAGGQVGISVVICTAFWGKMPSLAAGDRQ